MDSKIDQRTQVLATRDDIAALCQDFDGLRLDTKNEISSLREDFAALRQDFVLHRLSTKEDMMKLKEELLRTILLTSLGQQVTIVACVISLILVFVRK